MEHSKFVLPSLGHRMLGRLSMRSGLVVTVISFGVSQSVEVKVSVVGVTMTNTVISLVSVGITVTVVPGLGAVLSLTV